MLAWGSILVAAGTVAFGRLRWQQKTTALRATMRAAWRPSSVATYDAREIETLPLPVHTSQAEPLPGETTEAERSSTKATSSARPWPFESIANS